MEFKDLNHAMLTLVLNNNTAGSVEAVEAIQFLHELANTTNKAVTREPNDDVMSLVRLLVDVKVEIDRWNAITSVFVLHPSLIEKLKTHEKCSVHDDGVVLIWGVRIVPCLSLIEEHVFGFTDIDNSDEYRISEGFYAKDIPELPYEELIRSFGELRNLRVDELIKKVARGEFNKKIAGLHNET